MNQQAVAEMEGKNENRQECSFLNPEKCACQDTPIIGVEMCVTPAAPMDRNAPELLSSAQPSWMN
jgi:pyocin large subunit-like protein